ncbi:MAG: rhodanese-like domain-containing protein [Chitinophagaceae bacterium]|nr:rhodanese-like domain-containing protein [Chitinophagaceae bacterium]MCB0740372.1 rhodanese-like domain-containing protein [Chitinophagaceae bacterium]
MSILSFLGFGKNTVQKALENGAVIIDVRTVNEYDRGRIPESLNIPVNLIDTNIERIKGMERPVVCCCESGMRSGKAVRILKSHGIKDVHNGGNWMKVLKMVNNL